MNKITESFLTLSPAYGRDYTSGKAAKANFLAGKDFIIETYGHGSKPCSIADFASRVTVNIRFKRMTQVCVVKTP